MDSDTKLEFGTGAGGGLERSIDWCIMAGHDNFLKRSLGSEGNTAECR